MIDENGYNKVLDEKATEIGDIANYYGGLHVSTENGIFYWSLENHDGFEWVEISQPLFQALKRHERIRLKEIKNKEKDIS